MAKAVILDAWFTEEVLARRRSLGLDRWDEAWDGVWHMPPAPSLEHQRLEADLLLVLKEVVERSGLGRVFHDVNVADPERGLQDFRIPDISVVLHGSRAQLRGAFIEGGPDFVVEIHSPGDETYEKLQWYADQGVRELLIIHRDTKALALYRNRGGRLMRVAASPSVVESDILPLRFELIDEEQEPRLRISHVDEPERHWVV